MHTCPRHTHRTTHRTHTLNNTDTHTRTTHTPPRYTPFYTPDSEVTFIKFVGNVPPNGTESTSLLDDRVEETETEKQFLKRDIGGAAVEEGRIVQRI